MKKIILFLLSVSFIGFMLSVRVAHAVVDILLDLINNKITPISEVLYQLDFWAGSAGRPVVGGGTASAGRSTFSIINVPVPGASGGSAQLNGTAVIRFIVL